MKALTADDVDNIAIGAHFLSCAIDPSGLHMYAELTKQAMHTQPLRLAELDELPADGLVVAVGLVTSGLLMSEMPPCGDEMRGSIDAIATAVGGPLAAVFSLAAANVNGVAPLLAAVQAGLPVADADPMGRVFPLIGQTTLNAAGVPIGPIALTGVTGERVTIEVTDARRADAIVRSATEVLGGWAASAMYPCRVHELRTHGVTGSITRLLDLGTIMAGSEPLQVKYRRIHELAGTTRIARAQVTHVESSFGPSEVALPAQPSSVTLVDDVNGRVIRLEIQNEILAVLIDGAAVAAVPDIFTLIDPDESAVINLDDLRVGDVIDVLNTPADARWYTPAGLALAGPAAFGIGTEVAQR